jgi:hypothetical protein
MSYNNNNKFYFGGYRKGRTVESGKKEAIELILFRSTIEE